MDSIDQDSIVGELADVAEVVDGILSHISVGKDKLIQRQKQKREKTGGFKDGMILLETRNPLPTQKGSEIKKTLFDDHGDIQTNKSSHIDDRTIIELGHKIDKWSDRREHQAASEVKLRFVTPIVLDNWDATTPETVVDLDSNSCVRAKIVGTRLGSKLQIEVSIFTNVNQPKQLKFSFDPIK